MRHDLTDLDVLTFAIAGCNANEIAEYSGTSAAVAQARLDHVLHQHRRSDPNPPTPHQEPPRESPRP